jgi:[protein-PII] uridylyltransferase
VARALPKLQRDLQNVISGAVAPRDLASPQRTSPWSERPSPTITTHVTIDNRASTDHTVVEVMTKDRPGLLYTLSQALHEMSLTIAIAKINTEGTRVADVFYITEADGSKIAPGQRTDQVREGILASLVTRRAS